MVICFPVFSIILPSCKRTEEVDDGKGLFVDLLAIDTAVSFPDCEIELTLTIEPGLREVSPIHEVDSVILMTVLPVYIQNIRGGYPIPNSRVFTLNNFATSRCHNSWKTTTTNKIDIKLTIVINNGIMLTWFCIVHWFYSMTIPLFVLDHRCLNIHYWCGEKL